MTEHHGNLGRCPGCDTQGDRPHAWGCDDVICTKPYPHVHSHPWSEVRPAVVDSDEPIVHNRGDIRAGKTYPSSQV